MLVLLALTIGFVLWRWSATRALGTIEEPVMDMSNIRQEAVRSDHVDKQQPLHHQGDGGDAKVKAPPVPGHAGEDRDGVPFLVTQPGLHRDTLGSGGAAA